MAAALFGSPVLLVPAGKSLPCALAAVFVFRKFAPQTPHGICKNQNLFDFLIDTPRCAPMSPFALQFHCDILPVREFVVNARSRGVLGRTGAVSWPRLAASLEVESHVL